MSDSNSIINLGDLAKPATVLIEKISNAVGVLYEPRRIKKKAEAEAEAKKIKAIANIELNDIQQRGIERLIQQEERKQKNIEAITLKAVRQLGEQAKPEGLEEDWIANFFDKCDKISDDEMQTLWAKLLAGEATTPGTYSKRTVELVASMDKRDANLFTNFCQFVWEIGEPTPLIFNVQDKVYQEQGIDFDALKHLDAIGLISFESISGYRKIGFMKDCMFGYHGLTVRLEFARDGENQMHTGTVILTLAGQELFSICGSIANKVYSDYVIKELAKQQIIMTL